MAIIFSVNLKLINETLLQTEYFRQNCIAEVRNCLTRIPSTTNYPYQLSINDVDLLFENIFSEFDINEQQVLEKAPLTHFRVNCTVVVQEECIDFSPIPPFTNVYSMLFDGVNEYISTPSNATLDIAYNLPFTISMWVKIDSLTGGLQSIISKYNGAATRGYFFAVDSLGRLRIDLQNNGGANGLSAFSVNTVSLGVWQHICVTYDGGLDVSGVNFYIDSVKSAITPNINSLSATISNSVDFEFGRLNGSLFFGGNMDEFRIWNIEFNLSQVSTDYNGGIPTVPAEAANLVARCAFGDGGTWDGSNWLLPDEVGAFSYTSVNMENADRTTDVP